MLCAQKGKRVLILDWRDPFHPLAGGAERITQKYAEYWAVNGHRVFWLSNQGAGQDRCQEAGGVSYRRVGPELIGSLKNYLFCYPRFLIQAVLAAKRIIGQERIEVVIDQIHGLPYFSPLFSRARNVLMVCEVAGVIWDRMFPFPISTFGKIFEKTIYRLYRRSEVWAISENTRRDIIELEPGREVKVLPLGVDPPPGGKALAALQKFDRPSAVFVARLVPMKGAECAIGAAERIMSSMPSFHLYLLGSGSPAYVESLKDLIERKGLRNNVTLAGFVNEREKYELLRRSHFLFNPSHKEGWGITVVEAGLVGTPSIVRAGSSMDSLVRHGESGYLFEQEEQMSEYFIAGYNSAHYGLMSSAAAELARGRLWGAVLGASIGVTGL